MSTRGFHELTSADATPAQRQILDETRARFGMVPPAVARLARSPEMFRAFQAGTNAFDQTSLTPIEREVVILVLARDIGCDVCTAMHTALIARLGAREVAVEIAAGVPDEPRLAALARFTASMLEHRGDPEPGVWDAFLAAGFTHEQALEIVIGIGIYTMSTYANRLTGAHGLIRGSRSAAAASAS
jgi:AhpD family alkylhydroperoxidase